MQGAPRNLRKHGKLNAAQVDFITVLTSLNLTFNHGTVPGVFENSEDFSRLADNIN